MSTRRNTSAREMRAVRNTASKVKVIAKKLEDITTKKKESLYKRKKRYA
jgi:hypothetical protein